MLLPQVPTSIFILSFRSRWHGSTAVARADEPLIAEKDNRESVTLSPASEGRGVKMKAPARIARPANSDREYIAGRGRAFVCAVRKGLIIRLTVDHSAPLTCPSVKVFTLHLALRAVSDDPTGGRQS